MQGSLNFVHIVIFILLFGEYLHYEVCAGAS